jgi:tetratricopeptide (TPR) repeat protein
MKRLIPAVRVVALVLFFALIAMAQYNEELTGRVLDLEGKPYLDAIVKIKNIETGTAYTLKINKDGSFIQIGLKAGVYEYTVTCEKDHLNYPSGKPGRIQVIEQDRAEKGDNFLDLNFKEIEAATLAANPEEVKKREEEENLLKSMQSHFKAGAAAMNDAADLRKQLATATPDQKAALQEKRLADCQNAVNEFQLAEKGVGPKDIANHSTIWYNLGIANECAGHSDDAAIAFQNAIDLKPTADAYRSLSTNLATVAVAQSDPKAAETKLADASAACDKAIAIDPTLAAPCWKNIGIVLTNKGRLKEAVTPLQKATQADPKDAQAWFLLGGAFTAMIDTKTEGGKEIYIIPPGTVEAYQSCIDAAPTGPYAPQAKEALDNLSQLTGGLDLTISKRKHK